MPVLGCEAHRSAPAFLANHAPGPLTVNARRATKSCFTEPWTARPWEGDDACRPCVAKPLRTSPERPVGPSALTPYPTCPPPPAGARGGQCHLMGQHTGQRGGE